jgi:hypothetical protein
MSTVSLSPTTYRWLQRKAQEHVQTPDQIADALPEEYGWAYVREHLGEEGYHR